MLHPFAAADGQSLVLVPANVDVVATMARVYACVRQRVLAAYRRHGVLSEGDEEDMAAWAHGGRFYPKQ
jgi:hypothetical protein